MAARDAPTASITFVARELEAWLGLRGVSYDGGDLDGWKRAIAEAAEVAVEWFLLGCIGKTVYVEV